ncbi:MAG TPA: histidine kinase [Streptosporangiaceae bacterium]|jgi:signal transduction histidine kinase
MRTYSQIMRLPAWRSLASPQRVDLAVALGLLVWGLPDVPWWWEPAGHAGSPLTVAGSLALTLAMSLPFLWRRRFPVAVLALAASVLAVRALLGRDETSAFVAVLVGAYGLGAYSRASRRYARWLGWVALVAAVAVVAVSNGHRYAAAPFALLAAALVLGDAASARRGEAAAAVEAAHQAERSRIARELHDVVAHQLSAIAVQAGAARLALAQRAPGNEAVTGRAVPGLGSAGEVLGRVELLSREALTELGHLLGALRRDPDGELASRPAPTVAELGSLIETARAQGVPAELSVTGRPHPLPAGAELSCYRIVSEALTNVARHSPGAAAQVALCYQPEQLRIEIASAPAAGSRRPSPGPRGRALPGPGLGIRGMRERAELYGGRLDAGPRPDGGFRVTAVIPYCDGAAAGGPP